MVDNAVPEVVAPQPSVLPVIAQEMSIEQVVARVNKVRELQKRVMKQDVHYGLIPGTPKPTLLKPGAELLLLTFMLDPQYEHTVTQEGKHREILSRCVLYHIPTGNRVASGQGSCSTWESKYFWRKKQIECPRCHKELRRSKTEWYCWRKKGGCGSTYPLAQFKEEGRVENPDIADQYNTVLKMSNKRSLTAAVLNATAASEIFTQDVEDFVDEENAQPHSDSQQQSPTSPPEGGSETSAEIPEDADGSEEAEGEGKALGADSGQSSAPMGDRPLDDSETAVISALVNTTLKRVKKAGKGDWNTVMAVIRTFSPDGIPGLQASQIEACTEALAKL